MQAAKIVMVVAPKDFRDEEYAEPRAIFDLAGYQVKVASSSIRPNRGRFGLEVPTDLQLDTLKADDFDAIVLVGGPGAQVYFRDMYLHQALKDFNTQEKLIAAICMAPTILSNAGLLKGKRATAYSSEEQTLRFAGATWSRANVEVDGNIVTANGPQSATEFGNKILEILNNISQQV